MRFLPIVLLCACAASLNAQKKERAERIGDIAADYWDLKMSTRPRLATQLGDHRFDADLESVSAEARANERALKLQIVDRASRVTSLSEAELLDRDVLVRSILVELACEECRFPLWHLDHLEGLQTELAAIPTYHVPNTPERAASLIARYAQVPRLIGENIANLRAGLLAERVAPEMSVLRVIAQLDAIIAENPFVPADAVKKEAIAAVVQSDVLPALRAFRSVLAKEVLPVARKTIAVEPECYANLIVLHTGLRLSPQEIHTIGLSEVARIRRDMAALEKKLKGKPRAVLKTREALLQNARDIVARAEAALPRAFSVLPKTKLEVRPIEAYREKEGPIGHYVVAPADHSQPAIYYLNTYAPEERALMNQEALAFHEAVPGHHLQLAIAQELIGVPTFRRETGQTAFVEGWALYAERLAKELDLYSNEASELGRLGAELWRAKRLVVDTGMHGLGWSRDQALAFMRDGATQPEVEIVNEIDRYITWPGQALAYKIGEREILRLREKAKRKLGARFDLKAFHAVLLSGGALPLDIVGARIDRYIEEAAQ